MRNDLSAVYPTSHLCVVLHFLIFTARKRSLRRLCFYRCLSVHRGGVRGCSPGGVHGCSGGRVWLLRGACVVAPRGACMVALGGVRGCSGGCAWLLQGGCAWLLTGGACAVAHGGHASLLTGEGACVVVHGGDAWLLTGGVRGFFDEIRSMSGRYASYWNAFLFHFVFWSFAFSSCEMLLTWDDDNS